MKGLKMGGMGLKKKIGGLGGALGGPKKLIKKPLDNDVADAKKATPAKEEDKTTTEKKDKEQSQNESEQNTKPNGSDEEESKESKTKVTNSKAQTKAKDKSEENVSQEQPKQKEKKEKKEKPVDQPKMGGGGGQVGQHKKHACDEVKVPFTQEEAETYIAEYMEKHNRPYGVQDILNQFQGRLKKPLCQKVMDELTEANILTLKEYGKAKIYLINQDLFDTASEEQLTVLDEQIKVRKDEFNENQNKDKELVKKFKEASCGDTNDSLEKQIKEIEEQIKDIETKLDPFKLANAALITQDELDEAAANLKNAHEEWKRRRNGCMNVAGNFSESANMSKKAFLEKLEVDPDEAHNVVCPL